VRRSAMVTSAAEAVAVIPDRAVVAVSGFNMAATPEYLLLEAHRRYVQTGHPRDLFLIADALPAIPGRGLDTISEALYKEEGQRFLRGASVPFLGFSPWLQKLVIENMIEAYSWPMGVAAYWFREVSSGRPGVISKIGIDTSIDPKKDGGKLNGLAEERRTCTVKRIDIDGEEYLIYEAPKPTVALIRGTTADSRGSISMEDEAMRGTVLNIAQATKAHPDPGVVIAQVKRVLSEESNPRVVEVPGPFVDYVVVSPNAYHWQTGSLLYDPAFGSKSKGIPDIHQQPAGADERVIARRVLAELSEEARVKGSPIVVNLGIGIPALVSRFALEEGISDFIVTVLESGQWGGMALQGVDFGVAVGPFALSTMPDMFSNFEGGTIDAASLGFLQVGANGDVNPSMLPGRLYGPGGFPVIAGGSPRIYFTGAFTAGKAKVEVEGGKLRIIQDGAVTKFVKKVYKNFFSGSQALRYGKRVLYVTERAVFGLTQDGLELKEVAPGVDLDRDIMGRMDFKPAVSKEVKEMDRRLFLPGNMGLAKALESS